MKSPLADAARRSLLEDVKRMTAEQRLAAFLAHCQLMAKLAIAGVTGLPRLEIRYRRRRGHRRPPAGRSTWRMLVLS